MAPSLIFTSHRRRRRLSLCKLRMLQGKLYIASAAKNLIAKKKVPRKRVAAEAVEGGKEQDCEPARA
jgi:hypothetical protein